jgi:DNA polymerase-4
VRIICLLAPHLPVQVERQADHALDQRPLVVGGRPWDAGAVLDCCAQASAAGVRPGMRLAQAEHLCPTARFVPAREELYHAAHQALRVAAGRFTGRIESAALGQLYIEATGLERAFAQPEDGRDGAGRRLLAELVREARKRSGLEVQAGLAGGKFCAEQAARALAPGAASVVPPGAERAFLSPLPISVLPAIADMQPRLTLLGIRTLGALAALPRLAIVRQFGPQAGPLHDLACGFDPRPVCPDAPPPMVVRRRTFDDPLDERGPLIVHADALVQELATLLSARGYQAEGLRLQLEEEGGAVQAAGAAVKPPSADAERLVRLARRVLGTLAPAGPIAALAVSVYPLRPFHLGATQLALFGGTANLRQERLAETLRLLRERFGELAVMIASLIKPPPPRPVQVTTDPAGLPRALVWQAQIHEVTTIHEAWREYRHWWSRPDRRDYFLLETRDGQLRLAFRDADTDHWWLERHPL